MVRASAKKFLRWAGCTSCSSSGLRSARSAFFRAPPAANSWMGAQNTHASAVEDSEAPAGGGLGRRGGAALGVGDRHRDGRRRSDQEPLSNSESLSGLG